MTLIDEKRNRERERGAGKRRKWQFEDSCVCVLSVCVREMREQEGRCVYGQKRECAVEKRLVSD